MDNRLAFGPVGDRLGFALHWSDVRAMADLSDRLAVHQLTPARATALIFIGRNEGTDQTSVGRALGINRANAMKTIDRLVAIDAVERKPGRDRRTNALYLTAHGRALAVAVETITERNDKVMFGSLSGAERVLLRGLLDRVGADVARVDAAQ